MFLFCRSFVVNTTFSTGLVGVEVTSFFWLGQFTVKCLSKETEVTSTPTIPGENVVLTTKGLQDRHIQILDGTALQNKGKTIN